MDDINIIILVGLFFLAFVGGVIDAIAGGGGLITLPGLLSVGLDPVSALATHKFQGIFSSLSATVHFWKKRQINPRDYIPGCVMAILGSLTGVWILTLMDESLLKTIVPFLLIIIVLIVLFKPNSGVVPAKAKVSSLAFVLGVIPVIGFYDGFFGPGTGMFFTMGGVVLLGMTLQAATIQAKLYNFMTNLAALLLFIWAGHVAWLYGCVMACGTAIGGYIGARLIVKHGANIIKPILITMCLLMSFRLLWQQVAPILN